MTREEAKNLLPIIQAYAKGKVIESRCIKGDTSLWYDGIEKAFWNKPKRCEKHGEWWGGKMVLPKGCVKKLIGRELSWNDEPVELK